MSFFWQITLVESLLNVAVFAGAVIAYGPLRAASAHLPWHRERAESLSAGAMFGVATAAALFLPVHLEGGAAAGCQTVLLALAAPLAGPAAAVSAILTTIAIQLLPWIAGDSPDPVAIAASLGTATAGLGVRLWLTRNARQERAGLRYVHLPLLGALSAAGSLLALWIGRGRVEAAAAVLPALGASVGAAVVLGTLLLHEKRRYEAEAKLAQSRADLARQAQELEVALGRAESASRAKSAFLANMSHELRTPLNAILGYAQLLQRDRGIGERQAAAVTTIRKSGEHLLMLITDILDLSKIEAGKLELVPARSDLRAFLQGVADIMRIRADDKAIIFRFEATPQLPRFAEFDEKRLRQVLLNLLGNAVKFTDRGEVAFKVGLLAKADDCARLRFEVVDTGVGIAEQEVPVIFKPFEQVGEAQRRAGGTGLGLSISRELVRLMGGDIEVASKLGQGSCFWFELNLPVVSTADAVAESERPVTGYAGARRRILVVDDKPANRAVLTDMLHQVGFLVHVAVDGRDSLERAEEAAPDLVLMDIRMPVMDGLEATRQMRQSAKLRDVPIVAVSAGSTGDDAATSRAAGANAYITKPIALVPLLREIGQLIRLEWLYDQAAVKPQGIDQRPPEAVLVPPPAVELEALHKLAVAGNMRGIRRQADHICGLDPRFAPFADKLRQLAQTYQSKAILGLVELHMRHLRVQP